MYYKYCLFISLNFSSKLNLNNRISKTNKIDYR